MISQHVYHLSIYGLAGVLTGLMAGILGIGGGIIVVPALLFIYQQQSLIPSHLVMHMAVGTSLAIMIFTSITAIIAHHKKIDLNWDIFSRLYPGLTIGVIIGGTLADLFPTTWLQILLALFLILVAIRLLTSKTLRQGAQFPASMRHFLIMSGIGLLAGLLGIGGGLMIIPYLLYCGVHPRETAALSSLCTLIVAIVGTFFYSLTGLQQSGLPNFATGYIYWPAVIFMGIPSMAFSPLGASLSYRLPLWHLRLIFAIILVLTAIDLIFSA